MVLLKGDVAHVEHSSHQGVDGHFLWVSHAHFSHCLMHHTEIFYIIENRVMQAATLQVLGTGKRTSHHQTHATSNKSINNKIYRIFTLKHCQQMHVYKIGTAFIKNEDGIYMYFLLQQSFHAHNNSVAFN